MSHPVKALALGTAAFLAAALNAPLFAQVTNPATGPQGVNPATGARSNVNVNANANANANAAAADDPRHTQWLITHALNMAVNGGDLQLAAQGHGRHRLGQGHGDGQARNRNADDRNENRANNDARNANAENRRNDDRDNNANAENRRNENANANAADRRDQDQDRQAHQQAIHQLRVHAWRQFESGERLLREANATLNAEGNNNNNNNNVAVAGAARDDSRNAWSRRLSAAAEQYATTLRALTGVGSRAPEASAAMDDQNRNRNRNDRERDRAEANQNQANRGNDNQNENSGWLNRGEAAQVALLNQAVREAIEAFELNQAHHHTFGANQAAAVNASAQRLQEHARQMSADSQQIVQQVQAGLNNPQGNQDRDRQGNQANQDQNRQANQDQNQRNADAGNRGDDNNARNQGRASVRLLAQQAQQVVETLQRINPAAGQAGAAAPAR